MARKGNPISIRLGINRSSDSSWFSDYYYGQFVYQDVNLRSYLGSIRPPTRLTFGFRLGRCIILHFPKRTFIHFFLPRRPRRLKRREKARPGKERGQWWTTFRKAGPIRLNDRKKQNEIRGWPTKTQRYRYINRSPSIKKNLSKLLRSNGVSDGRHPKWVENDDSFRKTKLFKFFLKNKSHSDFGPTSYLRKKPAVTLHFFVMQYFLNTKNQMNFEPAVVLNHFVAPGADEPSGRANAQGRGLLINKRIRSRIAFFVESSTSEKKGLTHFICLPYLRFAGTTKTTISLFPFFGATFFFLRDGVGAYNNLDAREQLLNQLRVKCWNLMGKDKVLELIERFKNLGGIEELRRVIDMMIEIILRKRGIPYRYNSYFYEVKRIRSFLSNRTKTKTLIESVKIKSVYQSASPIAQDISFQLKNKRRSFHSIFAQIVKELPKGVEGIRICFSGRLKDAAEKAQTKCYKHRKTSHNVFHQKIDYAPAEVSTRYGISGVKIWISYSRGRAISKSTLPLYSQDA